MCSKDILPPAHLGKPWGLFHESDGVQKIASMMITAGQ
jgi:hypothetical protein